MRNWARFILCVLLSAGVWLIHDLMQDYDEIVSVPIIAESNIEGRARRSSTEVTVSAMVRTTGFRLLGLSSRNSRSSVVVISENDFQHVSGDVFRLPSSNAFKYASAIFGDGVVLENLISSDLLFRFAPENHKKVPVRPVHVVTYKSQYTAVGEMKVEPDSVVVYGDPARLDGIDFVLTKQINHSELRNSVHGSAKLQVPSGVRLSAKDVVYSLDVTRYVEVRTNVKIATRNVPADSKLSVLPSTATVSFRCAFPMGVNPVDRAEFYVDYRDFANSLTGRCVVRCDGLPEGVISYEIDPEVCECVE